MSMHTDGELMSDDTSIRVSEELADELYRRKGRGTSYEDFIWRLLECVDEKNEPIESGDREAPSTAREPAEPKPDLRPSDNDCNALRDELAGSGDLLDRRAEQVVAMYEYLREHGAAEKDELLSVVDVDATGYASEESVWSNMVKGKNTLRALPGVETPPTGRTTWRYVGENGE